MLICVERSLVMSTTKLFASASRFMRFSWLTCNKQESTWTRELGGFYQGKADFLIRQITARISFNYSAEASYL
jgi:hypothetical protein